MYLIKNEAARERIYTQSYSCNAVNSKHIENTWVCNRKENCIGSNIMYLFYW